MKLKKKMKSNKSKGASLFFLTFIYDECIISSLEPAGSAIVRWMGGSSLSAIKTPRSVYALLECYNPTMGINIMKRIAERLGL